MNIFLYELRAYRKSTIIWTISLCAVEVLFLLIYPGVVKDAAELQRLLMSYPEMIRNAMGIAVDNFTSFLGFYSFSFLYVTLCGAIQAMNIGTGIVSKEVREKTADFLLTKPVSRKRIMTAKLLAALTSLVLTNVTYLAVVSLMGSMVATAPFSKKIFLMVTATLFFVQLIFAALGVLIAVIVPKIKSVIAVSLSTVFGFFVVGMFGSLTRYLTPLKYYDPTYIVRNAAYETQFMIVELIFIVVAIVASYWIYMKKDIHTV